ETMNPLCAGAGDYILWTDDGMQRKLGAELGVGCVATSDVVSWMERKGNIAKVRALRARARLFSFGHDGVEFGSVDAIDLISACVAGVGEGMMDDIFNGLRKSVRSYLSKVHSCAHLIWACAGGSHVAADRYLVRVLDLCSSIAVSYPGEDFLGDVLAKLSERAGDIYPATLHFIR